MKRQLLYLEILVTAILVGLIWVIQRVHYPSFHFVNSTEYQQFQSFHVNAITPIVFPLMVFELCIFFFNIYYKNYSRVLSVIVFMLILTVWLATALFSVPIHNQLALGKNSLLINQLIDSNWIRTFAWTLKLLILSVRFRYV
jgi:hypothetical protein